VLRLDALYIRAPLAHDGAVVALRDHHINAHLSRLTYVKLT
jgi:hypothetical protein